MPQRDKYREKILNALLFFAKELKEPYKTSLFKMLWHFDYEHFKQTARDVTNESYLAMDNGPVPKGLYSEMTGNSLPEDFARHFDVERPKPDQMILRAKTDADLNVFTPRQIEILKSIVSKYRSYSARRLCESTHAEGDPWKRTYIQDTKRIIDLADVGEIPNGLTPDDVREYKESRKLSQTYSDLPF